MQACTWICSAATIVAAQSDCSFSITLVHTYLRTTIFIKIMQLLYNAASQPHWFHAYLRLTIFINIAQLLYNFLEQIVQHLVLLEGNALLCDLCSRYRTCVAFFLAPTLPASTANVQLASKSQRALAMPSFGQCENATSHHYMLIAFSMVKQDAISMIPTTSYPCW